MIVRVGIENNNDYRSIAWALEHPGCFAYGQNAAEAQVSAQQAVRDYAAWVRKHGMSWMDSDSLRVQVEEIFDAYRTRPDPKLAGSAAQGTLIESFFRNDHQALTGSDVERGLQLLDWSRGDLLEAVQGLDSRQLHEVRPGERWSINGILDHVAHAEWWYQERIGFPFPVTEDELPADPLGSLELVRAHLKAILPKLEGLRSTMELEGELWSPRKMLRRAVWHERDHTQHIRKLR